MKHIRLQRFPGFTLAELLICLVIIGEIATFTIPKIITSQQNGLYTAITKEAMGTISATYAAYKAQNAVSSTFHISDMTQYLNYLKVDTASTIDKGYNKTGTVTCSASAPCLKLHNGAVLTYYGGATGTTNGNYFGAVDSTHYVYFMVDPDGVVTSSGTTNGPGKTVEIQLYADGKVHLYDACKASDLTFEDGGPQSNCPTSPAVIPPWFSW